MGGRKKEKAKFDLRLGEKPVAGTSLHRRKKTPSKLSGVKDRKKRKSYWDKRDAITLDEDGKKNKGNAILKTKKRDEIPARKSGYSGKKKDRKDQTFKNLTRMVPRWEATKKDEPGEEKKKGVCGGKT